MGAAEKVVANPTNSISEKIKCYSLLNPTLIKPLTSYNRYALLAYDEADPEQDDVATDDTVVASNCKEDDDTGTTFELSDNESI